ncbi:di-trans,poly-cis-decaprenylcistransferase [Candidatus Gracilibacteria bacterium]|nr:di-trans,poly-cis-decaprenylcistransferase [Candidatus Gracilibacteria bacterium]
MIYPKHVAIIPDGNRTRARLNDKTIPEAYMLSYQRGVELIEYTFTKTDVKIFTLWGLSTENATKRPKEEFDFLMNMYKLVDEDLDNILINNQINFKRIGNPDGITDDFKEYLDQKVEKTKCNSDKYFVFAINYGGRDEIIRGIKNLSNQKFNFSNLTEKDLSQSLDLGGIPNVELIIRTKGDEAQRTSGFMSWWIGYSELYFTEKKCPELDVEEYQKSLDWFNKMADLRNYGK